MFVTFEGPEGAGKSTALAAVSSALEAGGRCVLATKEPGAGALGTEIRDWLLNGSDLAPATELFLFLADRSNHVETIIKPALRQGVIVLCDRYTDSTVAYQGYGRGLDLDFLRRANGLATGGLAPDMTLLFDLPVEIGLSRLQKPDRMDGQSLEFHRRVREGFKSLAAQDSQRFVTLNAELSAEALAEQSTSVILRQLA